MALDPFRHGQECEVDRIDAQHLGQRVTVVLADRQLDLWMQLVEVVRSPA